MHRAKKFIAHWTDHAQIEYVNATMRSIRKVQMDCDIVAKCHAHPEWMQHPHQGVVFDCIQRTDATYSYMVYLPALRILERVNSIEQFANYSSHPFGLVLSELDHSIRVEARIYADTQ